MSHSSFLFSGVEEWERGGAVRRAGGMISAELPADSPKANREKYDRCQRAFAALREHFVATRPDVIIVYGDDQREQFGFENFPAFALFVGEEFEGYRTLQKGARATIKGDPRLAAALMTGLVERGFDPAFSRELPNKADGMGHAFMRPSYHLDPEYALPVVPLFVNCYYGPQPLGRRCYELGRAVREIVEAMPGALRVAVVGSGGLWHTPREPESTIDRAFDERILAECIAGDARGMAEFFDRSGAAYVARSGRDVGLASGGTGMVLGYGSGTGETRNWIAAAASAEGSPGVVVDYVPVHASPIGAAFCYWRVSG